MTIENYPKEDFTLEVALRMLVANCEALLCFAQTPEDWTHVRTHSTVFYLRRNTGLARALLDSLKKMPTE